MVGERILYVCDPGHVNQNWWPSELDPDHTIEKLDAAGFDLSVVTGTGWWSTFIKTYMTIDGEPKERIDRHLDANEELYQAIVDRIQANETRQRPPYAAILAMGEMAFSMKLRERFDREEVSYQKLLAYSIWADDHDLQKSGFHLACGRIGIDDFVGVALDDPVKAVDGLIVNPGLYDIVDGYVVKKEN